MRGEDGRSEGLKQRVDTALHLCYIVMDNNVVQMFWENLMFSTTPLGEAEELILLAIIKLGGNAYGVTVRREIELATGRPVAYGAIYVSLDRLERKGFVDSWEGEPTKQRGGRSRRYYSVNGMGHDALRHHQHVLTERDAARNRLLGFDSVRIIGAEG